MDLTVIVHEELLQTISDSVEIFEIFLIMRYTGR